MSAPGPADQHQRTAGPLSIPIASTTLGRAVPPLRNATSTTHAIASAAWSAQRRGSAVAGLPSPCRKTARLSLSSARLRAGPGTAVQWLSRGSENRTTIGRRKPHHWHRSSSRSRRSGGAARRSLSGGRDARAALPEAAGRALERHHRGVVDEPVDQRRGDHRRGRCAQPWPSPGAHHSISMSDAMMQKLCVRP